MEEGIYYKEGWLESKVGGGTTDEGYLDRLIDEAFVMVERLESLWNKMQERILARQSTESEVVGP